MTAETPSPAPPAAEAAKRAAPSALSRLAIDLGPLLVFFLANAFAPVDEMLRIFYATGAFMCAIVVAGLYSYVRYRHISPLLLFSILMVVVLGGLTIYFHNETLIKMKPTIYYLVVAALLGFGLATGRNLLKVVLESVYPGLSQRGWILLTRNWAYFFVAMAAANEVIWRFTSTTFWAGAKLWLFLPATFIFALANVPMLMKHGLKLEDAAEDPPVPPSQ